MHVELWWFSKKTTTWIPLKLDLRCISWKFTQDRTIEEDTTVEMHFTFHINFFSSISRVAPIFFLFVTSICPFAFTHVHTYMHICISLRWLFFQPLHWLSSAVFLIARCISGFCSLHDVTCRYIDVVQARAPLFGSASSSSPITGKNATIAQMLQHKKS